ncbi:MULTISPECIES: hypothetical protein [Shewanella]|uniref:Lipoprotein n=1 Tax=Shewanella fidelis TaxID=173509 RepID=A0AAW8NMF4_9GAMM|nr:MULTISPECIES: hypothetical protein [Shewanella]MDR8523945.1 hypothetical protein [Shewanella fidelis]MDW4810492.1 hypothetical protein [Shewanella fidelis]MDW4814613.1 hypothetical protein [Shewanella fidelis]MDW4818703.1 hypothetical protein [Shewanella fidelis]MDW4823620.1 hypothetical protein [Shewanella fidelis]
MKQTAAVAKASMLIIGTALLAGCNIANHGSFVSQTYQDKNVTDELVKLGPVLGQSCQVQFLYVLPVGDSVSSPKAIAAAKSVIAGTKILTDVTIDDGLSFGIGYSEQCINVEGIAYGVAEIE